MKVETIAYEIEGRSYEGRLVYEPAAGPRPGVVMGPNWMGVTDHAEARARLLGAGRYTVFVADMYGAGVRPADAAQAAALANPLRENPIESRKRILGALAALKKAGTDRGVLDSRLAAVGFCFGGGNVLDLVRAGARLAAAVSIHGDLATPSPAGPGDIKAAVLAVHGSADPVAPKAQRDAFEAEMEAAGARWRLLVIGGAVHAFTDEGMNVPGVAVYDRTASRLAFDATHAFLDEAFASPV